MKRPLTEQQSDKGWEATVEQGLQLVRQASRGNAAIYIGFAVLTVALLGILGVLLWG